MPIISLSYLSYTALVLSVAKKNMIWRHTGTFPVSWVHKLIYTVSIPEPLKQPMVKFLNKLIKLEENKSNMPGTQLCTQYHHHHSLATLRSQLQCKSLMQQIPKIKFGEEFIVSI